MKKQKFKYNPDTLSYDSVELSWKERILRSLLVIAPAVILGFGFYILFSTAFKSSLEVRLERENANLLEQLTDMSKEVVLMASVVEDLLVDSPNFLEEITRIEEKINQLNYKQRVLLKLNKE